MYTKFFSFYDIEVCVETDNLELVTRIQKDFSFFEVSKLINQNSNIKLSVFFLRPEFEKITGKRRYKFRKTMTFDSNKIRYNNYQGELLSIYDFENEVGEVKSLNLHLLHEITYLLILSRVGKLLDLRGLHRIHGMFAQSPIHSILAVGASGVGKSTLLLNLCSKKYSFGADDTTLIDSQGIIYPFPIRAGFDQEIRELGEGQILKRREYGLKYLYSLNEKFEVSKKTNNAVIFLLERGARDSIKRASFVSKLYYLSTYLILGVGTPQIFEYFWEEGFYDICVKSRIFLKRCVLAFKLIRSKQIYLVQSQSAQATKLLIESTLKSEE